MLDEFAADVAPVWNRVDAVAIETPGLWRREAELIGYASLCDAARLADLTGLNVIDGFPYRDLAQDGRGGPLLLLPLWMLLHDARKPRALLDWGRRPRLSYLPASRDAACAMRSTTAQVIADDDSVETAPAAVARYLRESLPPVVELVVSGRPMGDDLLESLQTQRSELRVIPTEQLGVDAQSLKAAAVALLGLLHLDQAPANVAAVTGAHAPRTGPFDAGIGGELASPAARAGRAPAQRRHAAQRRLAHLSRRSLRRSSCSRGLITCSRVISDLSLGVLENLRKSCRYVKLFGQTLPYAWATVS